MDDIWIFAQLSWRAKELITLLRKRFKCTEPEYLCGASPDEPWAVARSLAGAPTFCATSVYFVAHGDRLLLVFSQLEFLEGAFTKLLEKGVVNQSDLDRPQHNLDSKLYQLDYLQEDSPKNPVLTASELTSLRAAVNTLSYAALRTKPELLPALGQCARGQTVSGRKRFLEGVINLVRYAYTTRARTVNVDTGIRLNGRSLDQVYAEPVKDVTALPIKRSAHFDASLGCAGASQDGFARQGSHYFIEIRNVAPALVLSRCGLQTTLSMSTTESELTSSTSCAKECVSQENFLRELFPFSIFPTADMYGDCAAANSIGQCLASLRRVRHLSLAQLWIRQATASGRVKITYINTKLNTADLLTKVLNKDVLKTLLSLLSIFDLADPPEN